MLDGILNILKPPGMTSHDVVSLVRKTLHTKKVGHAGTLDPDAAGVLPIFVGKATRLIEYATEAPKTYRVHMQFGVQTDTGDDSGNIIKKSEIYSLNEELIIKVLLMEFLKLLKITARAWHLVMWVKPFKKG